MYDKKKFKLSLALNICVYQKNYFNISFDIGIKLFYEQIYSCWNMCLCLTDVHINFRKILSKPYIICTYLHKFIQNSKSNYNLQLDMKK